ncbi:MAG: maleylpyruvate isomerase N-terminal domain-containing protein [Chloroflexota bacterium]
MTRIRGRDLRASDRDFWADEAAIWERMHATWAGLDDAAWHLPGAAPSDAGGSPWSLAEHVGHVADWQEIEFEYTTRALETGRWQADSDYDGGDFDTYNERRREPWTSMPRDEILGRLAAARPRLLEAARRLPPETIRDDDAWGWVYGTLHGHYLDHLAVIEPWAAELRRRQTDGDPFVDDPRAADHAGFLVQEAAITADFDALIRAIPEPLWATPDLTPGWTLTDHVGHLADWFAEGSRAFGVFEREGIWLADPDEGIDAWNERMVAAYRGATARETLARYDATRVGLLAAIARLSVDDLRSPDGWGWAYDCLPGHIRKHLAMLGSWASAASRDVAAP